MALTGGLKRKSKASEGIPTSSLADIAFLLLIFFMVTTVFRSERDRPIQWPGAEATQRIDEKRDNIMYVWLERDGKVYINDREIAMNDVSSIVGPAFMASGRRLLISLRADAATPYRFVDQAQTQLKRSGALFVVFGTELERRVTGARR
jgi:biopolymer transport protein ExbD